MTGETMRASYSFFWERGHLARLVRLPRRGWLAPER
jgi:hypothetical protein